MITLDELYHITLSSGVHAIFFIIFASILYFTVITKLEQDIFTSFIVDGAKEYSLDKIQINDMQGFRLFMNMLKAKADEEQESFREHNTALVYKTIRLILIIIVCFFLYVKIMPRLFKVKHVHLHFDYYKLMKETFGIILIVGIYEYLFIKYIVLDHTYYSFNKFLYEYLVENINNIKKYVPTILMHFIIGTPNYDQYIPNNIKQKIVKNFSSN